VRGKARGNCGKKRKKRKKRNQRRKTGEKEDTMK
jgi:hypothetical protein